MDGALLKLLKNTISVLSSGVKILGLVPSTGSEVPLKVDTNGELQVDVLSTSADAFTEYSVNWATKAGAFEHQITVPAGKYLARAASWAASSDGVAATVTVYVSTDTGFTPGNARHGFYTSASGMALPAEAFSSCNDAPITVLAAGKVYVRVVPDADTTSGTISIYLRPAV